MIVLVAAIVVEIVRSWYCLWPHFDDSRSSHLLPFWFFQYILDDEMLCSHQSKHQHSWAAKVKKKMAAARHSNPVSRSSSHEQNVPVMAILQAIGVNARLCPTSAWTLHPPAVLPAAMRDGRMLGEVWGIPGRFGTSDEIDRVSTSDNSTPSGAN